MAPTRASVFVAQDAGEGLLEGAALLICACHPGLLAEVESRLERLAPRDDGRAALVHDLLAGSTSAAGDQALQALRGDAYLSLIPVTRPGTDPEDARIILHNALDRLEARRAGRAELARAEAEIAGETDEGLTWRMNQMARARQQADQPEMEDSSDLGEDRAALASQLAEWMSGEIWRKGPGKGRG